MNPNSSLLEDSPLCSQVQLFSTKDSSISPVHVSVVYVCISYIVTNDCVRVIFIVHSL